MPLIAVDGVSHTYAAQRRPVLHDITVRLDEHRIGVIGANGSGKSTFARLLNGLIVPDSGTVTIDGHDTRRHGKQVRRLVGFCFTDPDAQIVMPTVAEDVAFSLRRRDLRGRALEGRVAEVLARFGLDGHTDHPLICCPAARSSCSPSRRNWSRSPLIGWTSRPRCSTCATRPWSPALAGLDEQVVLLTHHLELLDGFDRVLVFDEGRLVADAVPDEAVDHYRSLMRPAR